MQGITKHYWSVRSGEWMGRGSESKGEEREEGLRKEINYRLRRGKKVCGTLGRI